MPIRFLTFPVSCSHLLAVEAIMAAVAAALTTARAGFEEGPAAYREGRYPSAFRELLSSTERGHAAANPPIGNPYRDGVADTG